MKQLNLSWLVPTVVVAVASGCSGGSSGESTAGKWLEAPKALTIYLANTDLIMSGRDKEGCPVVIEEIRKDLRDGEANFGTQAVLEVCSTAGLGFGDEVACKGKRLQVKCK